MPEPNFVSVVVPVCTFTQQTLTTIRDLLKVIKTHFEDYELVLVDDHLQAESQKVISDIQLSHGGTRVIRLRDSFGLSAAISIGIEHAIGDYVVVFHPEQDPVDVVPQIVACCAAGPDVVYGIDCNRRRRKGLGAALSNAYHWYLDKFTHLKILKYATHLCCMNRHAVSLLKNGALSGQHIKQFMYFKDCAVKGFPYQTRGDIPADPQTSLFGAVSMGMVTIFENSVHPLQLLRKFSLLLSVAVLIFIFYTATQAIMDGTKTATPFVLQSLTGLVLLMVLLCIAVLIEYAQRIFSMTQRNQNTMIEYDNRSAKMVNGDRLNVVLESLGHD